MEAFRNAAIVVGLVIVSHVAASPVPAGSSFFQLEGPTVPALEPVAVISQSQHLTAHGEEFYHNGHPLSPHASSAKSVSVISHNHNDGGLVHDEEDDLEAARFAGRFGLEMERLENTDKRQFNDFIAAGYYTNKLGLPQPLPPALQHLSKGTPGGAIDLGGLGIPSGGPEEEPLTHIQELVNIDVKAFPTIFQGPRQLSGQRALASQRRGRVLFPPREGSRLVIKKSPPLFHSHFNFHR